MHDCLVCQRIALIKEKKNPYFITELPSGYVVFGDHQFYSGYTLLLSKVHTSELHFLPQAERAQFLNDMATVAEAVCKVFSPVKLNYELLGNKYSHLHWHIFPRHADDPNLVAPIWTYPKEQRCTDATKMTTEFMHRWQPVLKKEIARIIKINDPKQ